MTKTALPLLSILKSNSNNLFFFSFEGAPTGNELNVTWVQIQMIPDVIVCVNSVK